MPLLPIPGFSHFIEVNVRTYVYDERGTPGIWFYSLDLNSFLASFAARAAFSLPYFFSCFEGSKKDGKILIKGSRAERPEIKFNFTYSPVEGSPFLAEPETLDFFLIERYALFSTYSNQLSIQRIHHLPYQLSKVQIKEFSSNLLKAPSFNICDQEPDLIHYCESLEVDIF